MIYIGDLMKIGIPKGMYIYEKKILFENFFNGLGIEVIYSKDTDKEILENGIKYSIDEACLASKIYVGHIYDLVSRSKEEKIDYIFIPRICTFNYRKSICVKFFAMYDISKNIFDANFITLNIDYNEGKNEFLAFSELGKRLGFKYINIMRAYIKAYNMQKKYDLKKIQEQYNKLSNNIGKENILIVAHPYIAYDKYIGKEITKYLEKLGANVIYASDNKSKIIKSKAYLDVTKSIYWKGSINLINGIEEYKNYIDGIIYLTVFPCGVDSLVNELLIRKKKDIPSLNLILDEQEIGAGVYTRLESFYDILTQTRKYKKVSVSNE